MQIETIIVNFDSQLKRQICFFINDSKKYKVASIFDTLDEVKKLNKGCLLIVSLNTDTYATDFLKLNNIISNNVDISVVILATSVSKDIISNAFINRCAAIVDKQHFQLYYEFVLENILTYKGFYVSPLFIKHFFEDIPSNPLCTTVFLSKKQNDIIYYLTQGYAYLEISYALNLSINIIKRNIKLIYKKLNISSKYELIDILQKGQININPIIVQPTKINTQLINVTDMERKVLNLFNQKKSITEISSELLIKQLSTKYYIRKLKQKRLID